MLKVRSSPILYSDVDVEITEARSVWVAATIPLQNPGASSTESILTHIERELSAFSEYCDDPRLGTPKKSDPTTSKQLRFATSWYVFLLDKDTVGAHFVPRMWVVGELSATWTLRKIRPRCADCYRACELDRISFSSVTTMTMNKARITTSSIVSPDPIDCFSQSGRRER